MNLVTFAEHVSLTMEKSAGATNMVFEAGRDYVIAASHFNRMIAKEEVKDRLFKWSRIENRIPNFNANAKKPGTQKLLLYNGSGGYGDQVMTWPFARILASYGFEVHVLVDPGNVSCWWNMPFVKSIQNIPIQYEQFKMYDYWVIFETVVNAEEHVDQLHPLDQMLRRVGINPDAVDPKLKVYHPNFTFLEMQAAMQFQGKPIGMYQLSAANPVRCMPPNESAYLLSKVAEAYPNVHWLALYDKFVPEQYRKAVECQKCNGKGRLESNVVEPPPVPIVHDMANVSADKALAEVTKATESIAAAGRKKQEICPKCKGSGTLRHNIQIYQAASLRELWAVASRAAVVIGPDSMMVHIAGSLETPCVGLWGPCNPMNRVKYYKNHFPVWKKEVCQFSPCFAYAGTFPRYCPPRKDRQICECLGAVGPADVIEQLRKIIPTPEPPAK